MTSGLPTAKLVSPQELAAAKLSFLTVIDGAQAHLGVAQLTNVDVAPGQPTGVGTLGTQRAICWQKSLKNKVLQAQPDVSSWVQQSRADAGLIEQVLLLKFDETYCNFVARGLRGQQQLAAAKNVGSLNERHIYVQPTTAFVLPGGGKLQVSAAVATEPGMILIAPTQPAFGDNGLKLSFDLRVDSTDAAGKADATYLVSCQDSNQAILTQTLRQVGIEQTRDSTGATVDTALDIQIATVRVSGFAGNAAAVHHLAEVKADLGDSCRCPYAGTLDQSVAYDDGRGARHTYSFVGCGRATVVSRITAMGQVSGEDSGTVVWSDCGS